MGRRIHALCRLLDDRHGGRHDPPRPRPTPRRTAAASGCEASCERPRIEERLRRKLTGDTPSKVWVSLSAKLEEVRRGEVEKTFASLKDLGQKERKAIEALTSAIINKVLHQPITTLKQSQNDPSGDTYVDAVRALFDLKPPQPEGEIKPLDDHGPELRSRKS